MLDLRTEEELMTAAVGGDEEAFRLLALRLREVIGRFLRHLGCDRATVEDLTQETLLRLWTGKDRYQQRAKLRTFVLTIAKNLWLNHCRRKPMVSYDAPAGGRSELDKLLIQDGLPPGPEAALIDKYRAYRVRQAILGLPERQRIVFVLAHLEGLRHAEIAQMLGIAEGTVKSRMHRAIRGLRELLEADSAGLEGKEE